MSQVLGTSFATSGFSYDPNLSPNNQSFGLAVLAVVRRAGVSGGTSTTPGTAGALTTAVFANPSHKVSGTATNGTSTFAMRADAAPALDEAIAPTWTGTHLFAPAAGIPISLQAAEYMRGTLSGTSSQNFQTWYDATGVRRGYFGFGNTNDSTLILASEASGTISLRAGGIEIMRITTSTAPTIQGYGPVAAGLVDMTPDKGTFNGTATGLTTSPVAACSWSKNGNQVCLTIGSVTGSSNGTTFSIGQLPAAIQPTRSFVAAIPAGITEDNTATINTVHLLLSAGSALTFRVNGNPNAFTPAGTKGVQSSFVVNYALN